MKKIRFLKEIWKASRPLSLTLALYSTTLGMLSFLITALLGLYIISITTRKLILIGVLGIIGGYAYTGEPIVYKKRGLGTPLSFLLMGPLMVMGTHLVFSHHYSWRPIILGLPISLLIPVLMLSNELRDFERDKSLGIKTLTVRIGFKKGKMLYLSLLSSSYLLTIIFVSLNLYPAATLLSLLTLPLAVKAYRNVAEAEKKGVPVTNQLHLTFGLIQLLALFLF